MLVANFGVCTSAVMEWAINQSVYSVYKLLSFYSTFHHQRWSKGQSVPHVIQKSQPVFSGKKHVKKHVVWRREFFAPALIDPPSESRF